jgi:hypothetical protein
MKFILSIVVLALITGCSAETEKQPLSIPDMSNQSDEVKKLVTENWDAFLAQCPGLNKFQDDLSFSQMDDYLEPFMDDKEAWLTVTYVVSDDPKRIPNSYKAWGHHCHFRLYDHNKTIGVPKRACASVCLDKNMFLPENSYLIPSGEDYSASLID